MASEYDFKEWKELSKLLTPRQMRNALKTAYRREAKNAVSIAQARLQAVGPRVKGNTRDWKRGIRSYVYSRGGGFLVSVKARVAKSGKEAGMHENRRGLKKPILMWMEDGTKRRTTRGSTSKSYKRRKVHNTGTMYAYHILKNSEAQMQRSVERNLAKDVEEGVMKQAKKAGFF